jgi:hypothetical protein
MVWRVAGLRPKFFSSSLIFLDRLAQEFRRHLATVIYNRRSPHLHTQRKEKLPMGSEEEQAVVKTCRPNSKRTQLARIEYFFIQRA